VKELPPFRGLVDKEHQSLPARSEKAFTLYSLYDATKELLAERTSGGDTNFDELVQAAVDYWVTVSSLMPDWLKIRNREIRPIELRQENISTHSVVLRALGGGAELMASYPSDWKGLLAGIRAVDWSKKNRDWEPPLEGLASGLVGGVASDAGNIRSSQDDVLPLPRRPAIHPTEIRIGDSAVLRVHKSNQIPVVVGNWILKQGKQLPRIQNFVHETSSGFPQFAQLLPVVSLRQRLYAPPSG
jgi:hypothetical protein